jgi:hypothetical protein
MVASFSIGNPHSRSYVIAHFMQFSLASVLRCFFLIFGAHNGVNDKSALSNQKCFHRIALSLTNCTFVSMLTVKQRKVFGPCPEALKASVAPP